MQKSCTHGSLTQLDTWLKELGSNERMDPAIRLQSVCQMRNKITSIDTDFQNHHLPLIDNLEDDVELTREQEVIGSRDDFINQVTINIKMLMSKVFNCVLSCYHGSSRHFSRRLCKLEQRLTSTADKLATDPLRHVRTATWTRIELGLRVSAQNSLSMNLSRTRVEANPHSDVGWSEFNLGWRKCGFRVSDCIHACTCASAVCSKKMTGRQQREYSLVFGVRPMCRASLQSFEDFTKVSSSPPVLPIAYSTIFGSLWWIISAMASNSGGSSSNAISRSDRHIAIN